MGKKKKPAWVQIEQGPVPINRAARRAFEKRTGRPVTPVILPQVGAWPKGAGDASSK